MCRLAPTPVDAGRGQLSLHSYLSTLEAHDMKAGLHVAKPESTVTLDVNPRQVSLPDRAGAVRPGPWLPPLMRALVEEPDKLELPLGEWPPALPKGRHRVSQGIELQLARLFSSRVASAPKLTNRR